MASVPGTWPSVQLGTSPGSVPSLLQPAPVQSLPGHESLDDDDDEDDGAEEDEEQKGASLGLHRQSSTQLGPSDSEL